jgi:hypothetical protein
VEMDVVEGCSGSATILVISISQSSSNIAHLLTRCTILEYILSWLYYINY